LLSSSKHAKTSATKGSQRREATVKPRAKLEKQMGELEGKRGRRGRREDEERATVIFCFFKLLLLHINSIN
jgi:hypothetical protein